MWYKNIVPNIADWLLRLSSVWIATDGKICIKKKMWLANERVLAVVAPTLYHEANERVAFFFLSQEITIQIK